MYSLYVHVNKTNHKAYFGITSRSPKKRWANGNGYKQNAHFYSAIQKYGWDGFTHVVIRDDLTKEEACEKERSYISEFDTANPVSGYNNDLGGIANGKMSEATKRKLSASHKALCSNPEVRALMSDSQKKRFSDPDERKRLSDAHRDYWMKPESHTKASEAQKRSFRNNPQRREAQSKSHLAYYEAHPEARTEKEIPVNQYTLDGELVRCWKSAKEASEVGGFHRGHISSVCRGKLKKHGGYIWRYSNGLQGI